jgi:subtilisin family serine protease
MDSKEGAVTAIELAGLAPLINRTSGEPGVSIGLIDGPVALNNSEFSGRHIHEIPGNNSGACKRASSMACSHGTFVAGILSARRGSYAPALCPGCTLLIRPIFSEETTGNLEIPHATPRELAAAIIECVEAGARCINLSLALAQPSSRGERELEDALSRAASSGVMIVAAAGNQGALGSTAITRHPWVIPVMGCDAQGRPTIESNLCSSIGKRGLRAPGENITSLGTDEKPLTFSGTSAAAPFVTGALALLCSEFPRASAGELKLAITRPIGPPRKTLVPPLLNAWVAYELLAATHHREKVA